MTHTTLIAVPELAARLGSETLCIVDCRFDLADPAAGHVQFLQSHIPGAVFADLERDLSGPPTTDRGRHPLPPPARMEAVFSGLGIGERTQVVAYDDAAGMFAARLWWMLRYLGHTPVAVLDGGWRAWQHAGLPVEYGQGTSRARTFTGTVRRDRLVTLDDVGDQPDLVDARAPARYRGETEPLDPRPGHIPGARNRHFMQNVDGDGRFLPRDVLERSFRETLGTLPTGDTVHYCGSGVSACHNILAQVHAGLDEPRLYCGSWSEWCADPARPAATGATR